MERFIAILIIFFCLCGCASVGNFWTDLKGKLSLSNVYHDEQIASREEAARKYGYKSNTAKVVIEKASIIPDMVKPGSKIEADFQYTIILNNSGSKGEVTETRFIDTGGEKIQLAQRIIAREQGTHLSRLAITIPKDINTGTYVIITVLKYGAKEYVAKSFFKVEE